MGEILKLSYSVEREGMLIKSKLNIKPAASFLCHHLQKKNEPFNCVLFVNISSPFFPSSFLVKISDF